MNLTNSAAFLEVVVAQVVERWHSVCKKTSAAFLGTMTPGKLLFGGKLESGYSSWGRCSDVVVADTDADADVQQEKHR